MKKLDIKSMFFFKEVYWLFALSFLCMIATSYLGHLTPKVIYQLSANFNQKDLFNETLLSLGLILIGVFISRLIYQLLINKYVMLVLENIRTVCYSSWLHSYDLIENKSGKDDHQFPMGELISRLMNDTQAFRELLTSGALSIIISIVYVISCIVGFIDMDFFMGGTIAFFQVVATIALIYGSKYMRDIFHKVRASRGDVSRQMANITGGFGQVYYLDHKNYASKDGENFYNDFMRKQLKANVWDAGYYSVAESLYPLFIIVVIFVAPYSKVIEGALIFAIVDLIQRSIEPIKAIAGKIANIQRAYTGLERIQHFYDQVIKKESSANYKRTSESKSELKDLEVNIKRFIYPRKNKDESKRFELRDINFSATSGNTYGFVGVSGCGKSTLLKMLSGVILPDEGEIEVATSNGVIRFPRKEDRLSYRGLVSLISQDSHVFSESLRFNITLGFKGDDFDLFWSDVCRHVPYLLSWGISPEDTINLKEISDGQKQLICALRACYLKKEIVCFDEISSALDSDLELALRKLVQLIQQYSLTFIVAHRIETVLQADKIIVLKEGRVVDSGTNEELQKSSKYYQEFIAELER